MDLLTGIERNNISSVLKDYEVLAQAVAKLYLAFPNPNSWSYSNIIGVVSLVKRLNTFSFKIVDVDKKEIIWEYDIDSSMTYQKSEDYLHVFPYKTIKCMAGFSFTNETEGQEFYNCVINRHTSTKSSPVSSRIGSPKITATISPVTKNIEIETKTKDKKEKKHKKDKKEKKSKKGLFGFGSSKKSKKTKKGLDKSLIGKPTNFRHEQYIGFDPEKGFVTQNAGPEWQEIFKKAGITPEILADDRNRKIVNKFIKRHESEVKRSNPVVITPSVQAKKEKRPPPPPPPKKRAPPPPPPQRRPNQARKAPPPPPPQRKKQQRPPPPPPPQRKPNKKASIPPPPPVTQKSTIAPPPPQRPVVKTPSIPTPTPPPPPQRPVIQTPSIPAPPPPPPQRPAVQTSSIPVPPPPPPPPSNQKPSLQSSPAVGIPPPPPPPPASVSGSGAPPPPPPPPVPSTGNAKNDLLASIRNAGGIGSLKHVDESQKRDASGLITPGSSTGPRPAPPVGGSSAPKIGMSGDLLASIRNAGIGSLKHVDKSEIRDASSVKVTNNASSSANTNDLAAALAQALSMRNDAFGSDDDSDSDSDDSDSDSSEWSN